MKPLVYGEHARLQMRERHIPEILVRRTVRIPDTVSPAQKSRVRYKKQVRQNLHLVVIGRELKTTVHIITAYYTKI